MLNLCDSGHDEICFVGHTCPFCKAIKTSEKEVDDLNSVVSSLKDDVSSVEEKVRDLEDQLASLRERGDLA
jgi:predicted  nucleic acid-binding Zn-ribbon protein